MESPSTRLQHIDAGKPLFERKTFRELLDRKLPFLAHSPSMLIIYGSVLSRPAVSEGDSLSVPNS